MGWWVAVEEEKCLDSGHSLAEEPADLLMNCMEWVVVKGNKETIMSPGFLALSNRYREDGENWEIKISHFHMLSLTCLLDIYVEIPSRQLDINLEFRGKFRARNKLFVGYQYIEDT